MALNQKQQTLLEKQLKAHIRESGIKNIILDEESNISLDLLVEKGVFGSDIITTAIYLAQFLCKNKKIYAEKDVVDVGCGPGTQGIVMSKYGAKSVVFSDINPRAIINAQKNIQQLNLQNAKACESDLFNNFPEDKKFDVIVFNHPFFSEEAQNFQGDPTEDEMLRSSMLGGTGLLQKFLSEVKQYLTKNGVLIMPYFHFAGPENNPANHVKKYGLKIDQEHKIKSQKGFHLGDISIYKITEI